MKITSRIKRIIVGLVTLGTKRLENTNIEALISNLEYEKERNLAASYKKLVSVQSGIQEMTKIVEKLKKETTSLEGKAKQALQCGNEEQAATLALNFETTQAQYEASLHKLETADSLYHELVGKQSKINDEYQLRIQQVKLKNVVHSMNKQLADISGISGIADVSGRENFSSTIDNIDEIIDRKDNVLTAEVNVSRDMSNSNDDNELDKCILKLNKAEALQRLKDSLNYGEEN